MKLDPKDHAWMRDKAVLAVLNALPVGTTRFVGGCVRNGLLGVPVADIDLATKLEPADVKSAFDRANIRSVPTGIEHGTITAVVDGQPIEVTTLRKDVETDGRRAVIAFTKDWAEDAIRRDFTINALYADPDGTLHDPSGQGLDDIAARRFRFVGSADDRVKEDYLRILRYFRFLAWYTKDKSIDAEALKSCRENRHGLKKLSAERVWSELKKLLSAPDPSRAVRIMQTNDILEVVLPEASNTEGLDLMIKFETAHDLKPDPLLRLMAMAGRDEMAMAGLCKRLKLSNSEKSRILSWAGDRTELRPDLNEKDRKRAVYSAGAQVISDRAILRAAGSEDVIMAGQWFELAQFAQNWDVPKFPIKGRDLKIAGVPDGPRMGKILRSLEALWVKSGFEADKKKLMLALNLIMIQMDK